MQTNQQTKALLEDTEEVHKEVKGCIRDKCQNKNKSMFTNAIWETAHFDKECPFAKENASRLQPKQTIQLNKLVWDNQNTDLSEFIL